MTFHSASTTDLSRATQSSILVPDPTSAIDLWRQGINVARVEDGVITMVGIPERRADTLTVNFFYQDQLEYLTQSQWDGMRFVHGG